MMGSDTLKEEEARKAVIDFYLKDSQPRSVRVPLKRGKQLRTRYTKDAYWESLNTPRVVGGVKRKEKDFMFEGIFTSGGYVGYQLSDGSGAYIHWQHIIDSSQRIRQDDKSDYYYKSKWQEHPNLLKGWAINTVWDITDLVLPLHHSSFLNWTKLPWGDIK